MGGSKTCLSFMRGTDIIDARTLESLISHYSPLKTRYRIIELSSLSQYRKTSCLTRVRCMIERYTTSFGIMGVAALMSRHYGIPAYKHLPCNQLTDWYLPANDGELFFYILEVNTKSSWSCMLRLPVDSSSPNNLIDASVTHPAKHDTGLNFLLLFQKMPASTPNSVQVYRLSESHLEDIYKQRP
jgi:hypothetical protein